MGADYRKADLTPVMGGTRDAQAVNINRFYSPEGFSSQANAVANRQSPISVAGVLMHLYVLCAAAPGAGETIDVAVFVNGLVTALAVQIAGAVQVAGQDLVNMIPVVPGDTISVRVGTSAAAAVVITSWGFSIRT